MTKRNSTSINPSKQIKIGDVFNTNEGGQVVVLEYINRRNVRIKHLDDSAHVMLTESCQLRSGQIKNPYHPSVVGIGYLGVGKFAPKINNTPTDEYKHWICMLGRCYGKSATDVCPSYTDCLVCDDWLCYQNFAEWVSGYKYNGVKYELDKDLLVRGNKVYSPKNCAMVPQCINKILSNTTNILGPYPLGVTFRKENGKFLAQININSKRRHLGYYSTPEEAHKAYKVAKEAHVKEKALEWRSKIAPNVFDALMNWTVNP